MWVSGCELALVNTFESRTGGEDVSDPPGTDRRHIHLEGTLKCVSTEKKQ